MIIGGLVAACVAFVFRGFELSYHDSTHFSWDEFGFVSRVGDAVYLFVRVDLASVSLFGWGESGGWVSVIVVAVLDRSDWPCCQVGCLVDLFLLL